MLQNVTSFSPSYPSLLRLLSDPAQLRAHERVVQFPFVQPAAAEEKSGEELQRIQERRREQGRKLQEMARKARGEKVCPEPQVTNAEGKEADRRMGV